MIMGAWGMEFPDRGYDAEKKVIMFLFQPFQQVVWGLIFPVLGFLLVVL